MLPLLRSIFCFKNFYDFVSLYATPTDKSGLNMTVGIKYVIEGIQFKFKLCNVHKFQGMFCISGVFKTGHLKN